MGIPSKRYLAFSRVATLLSRGWDTAMSAQESRGGAGDSVVVALLLPLSRLSGGARTRGVEAEEHEVFVGRDSGIC